MRPFRVIDVPRRAILRELASCAPRIVRIVAPAGFGKTMLVRQYARRHAHSAACDLLGVRGAADAARRVIAALAAEDGTRAGTLAQAAVAHADDPRRLIAFAVRSWHAQAPPSLFVFDNAEALDDDVDARGFVDSLLSVPNAARRVAIVSRRPPSLRLGRYAQPHEIVSVGIEQLRFSRDEIDRAFARLALTDDAVDAAEQLSGGWPAVTILLGRLALAGHFSAQIAELRALDAGTLFDYLAEHVIDALDARDVDLVLTVVAVGDASDADLAWNDTDHREIAGAVATLSPLIARTPSGRYEAHPLIAALFASRFAGRLATATVVTGERRAARGDAVGAARCFLRAGEDDRAAEALGSCAPFILAQPSPDIADVLTRLDRSTLLRHPGAWNAATLLRAFTIDDTTWLDEAETVWRAVDERTPLPVAIGVLNSLANVYYNVGRFDDARVAVAAFCARIRASQPVLADAVEAFWCDCIPVITARSSDLTHLRPRIEPLLTNDVTRAFWAYDIEARIARLHGDRQRERALLDDALEHAERSGLAGVKVVCMLDAAFGAWLAGEDASCARYAERLAATLTPLVERGASFFLACLRGDGATAVPTGSEKRKTRAYAYVIAAALATTPDERTRLAHAAVADADRSAQPFAQILARIALSQCDGDHRGNALTEATALAAAADSAELRAAVRAVADGRAERGAFGPLVRRFAASRVRAVEVHVFGGTVSRDGVAVALSDREHQLLVALAVSHGPASRNDLLERLWPERDAVAATNLLKVYVNRLRKRLGTRRFVELGANGYSLAGNVHVDVAEAEDALRVGAGLPLDPVQRARLAAVHRAVTRPRLERMRAWPWFGPVDARLARVAADVTRTLCDDACAGGRYGDSVAYARALVDADPCDEDARELLMRVRVSAGDSDGAARELADFADVLARTLETSPSARLTALTASCAVTGTASDIDLPEHARPVHRAAHP